MLDPCSPTHSIFWFFLLLHFPCVISLVLYQCAGRGCCHRARPSGRDGRQDQDIIYQATARPRPENCTTGFALASPSTQPPGASRNRFPRHDNTDSSRKEGLHRIPRDKRDTTEGQRPLGPKEEEYWDALYPCLFFFLFLFC